ncbi:hypothetical protein C1645_813574 [Glomus cerebriforme]|uniref:Uncharacterized protein n=1 Tax=Glomus cerebriforme TaxID=658196 RepID=A0A397TN31_9GLOM|nr:hypothetical protein C1645_813574 [Glomus cerebriforme]
MLFFKRYRIRNARNLDNNNQESQQSINSKYNSLPTNSSYARTYSRSSYSQQSNITTIPENTEVYSGSFDDCGQLRTSSISDTRSSSVSEPCCNPRIVNEINEISREQYEIVKCPKAQNDNEVKKWYNFNIINSLKNKNLKVICHKGQQIHIITAKRIKDGKKVMIKRVEKENLAITDYFRPAYSYSASCECIESSRSLSIISTKSSNATIAPIIVTFNEDSLPQYNKYTGRSNSLPARSSLLINSLTFERNSSTSSIIKTVSIGFDSNDQLSLQNFDSPQNSPQTQILNNSSQLSNSPRTSIHHIPNQHSIHNHSPRTSIHNIPSQHLIHNIPSRNQIYNENLPPNSVGSTPVHAQIDKLRKSSVSFSVLTSSSSTSINNSASINSQSPALSIKSDSSISSMSVQPPSIHSYSPIELQCFYCNSNELPVYIDYFVDEKYYYYITKLHGVKQRKLKKPFSWFKKKYFKVNWDDYFTN